MKDISTEVISCLAKIMTTLTIKRQTARIDNEPRMAWSCLRISGVLCSTEMECSSVTVRGKKKRRCIKKDRNLLELTNRAP